VGAKQIQRILDRSQSWTYERLAEHQSAGLIASVKPRHPAISTHCLYHLTPAGRMEVGLPRRGGRPRFLERIATVYEVRNFFISLQRAGIELAQWQTLTPGVAGTALHGAAVTAAGQQLIVEWDRADRPRRLYRDRLRRVGQAAAETGAGLLVVAADMARGTAMLRALGSQLDVRGPQIGLTSRSIIGAEGLPGATCYIPALGQSLTLEGLLSVLPARSGQRPIISRGIMAFTGDWEGNAQLSLELSALQKQLLEILTALPLCTAEDLAPLARSTSSRWITETLWVLRDKGLVGESVADPSRLVRHYYPTRAGLAYLAACCGSNVKAYAKARGWKLRGDEVSISHLTRVFEHTEQMREFVLGLSNELAGGSKDVAWYDEREAHIYFTDGGRRRILAPDGRIHVGDTVYFVEMDRATGSTTRIADKLRQYYCFRRGGDYRRYGADFRVLVVVPERDADRERLWLDYTARGAARQKVKPLAVLATTLDRVRDKGVGADIWRGVEDRRRLVRPVEARQQL